MKRHLVRYDDGFICWYFKSNFHRDRDLPAVYLFRNGKFYIVSYWQHGRRHRTTGPAIINYKRKINEYLYQDNYYASLEQMLMVEACR